MADGKREAVWLRRTGGVSWNEVLDGDCLLLSGSSANHLRISSGVKTSDDGHRVPKDHKVDQVREAPEYRASNATMDHRVDERATFETIPKLIECVEELSSEPRSSEVVSSLGVQ